MSTWARYCLFGLVFDLACGDGYLVDDTGASPSTSEGDSTSFDPPTDTDPTNTPTTNTPTTNTASTAADTSTDGGMDLPPIGPWDMGFPDLPNGCGGLGPEGLPGANLPYIWVANTPEGTLSKISTETLVEEARYATAATPNNPSATSVSLSGNVVVANRNGGLTKVFATTDRCTGLNTSTGPTDVLPFGDDECVAWHNPTNLGPEALVAWDAGLLDQESCEWPDERLWITVYTGGPFINVLRIDGETGANLDSVIVNTIGLGDPGPSDGAVDSEGNFWFLQQSAGPLVRIDAISLQVQTWSSPFDAVGLAVDPLLGVWICGPDGVARFDVGTEAFDTVVVPMGGEVQGCASDGDRLWLAGGPRLLSLSLRTMLGQDDILLPESIHGVAVDFQGQIWGVSDNELLRVEPRFGTIDIVSGLLGVTTRSDMTGYGLAHVTN